MPLLGDLCHSTQRLRGLHSTRAELILISLPEKDLPRADQSPPKAGKMRKFRYDCETLQNGAAEMRIISCLAILLLGAFNCYGQITRPLEATYLNGLYGSKILCSLIDGTSFYVSTNDGLFRYSGGAFQRLATEPAIAADVTRIVKAPNGYVLSTAADLYYVQGSTFHVLSRVSLAKELGSSLEIKDLASTDDSIAAATTKGLAIVQMTSYGFAAPKMLFEDMRVRSLASNRTRVFALFNAPDSTQSEIAAIEAPAGHMVWRKSLPGIFLGLSLVKDTLVSASKLEVDRLSIDGDMLSHVRYTIQHDQADLSTWLLYADSQDAYVGGSFPNVVVVGNDGRTRFLPIFSEGVSVVAYSLFPFQARIWIGTNNGLYYRYANVRLYAGRGDSSAPLMNLAHKEAELPSGTVSDVLPTPSSNFLFTARGVVETNRISGIVSTIRGTERLNCHSPVVAGQNLIFASGNRLLAVDLANPNILTQIKSFRSDINTLAYGSKSRYLYVGLRLNGLQVYRLNSNGVGIGDLVGSFDARPTAGPGSSVLIGNNIRQILLRDGSLQIASDSGYFYYPGSDLPGDLVSSIAWDAGTDQPVRINQVLPLDDGRVLLGTEKGLRLVRFVGGKLSELSISDSHFASVETEIGKNEVRVLRQFGKMVLLAVDGLGLVACDPEIGAYTRLFPQDILSKSEINDIQFSEGILRVAAQPLGEIEVGIDDSAPSISLRHDGKEIDGNSATKSVQSDTSVFAIEVSVQDDFTFQSQNQVFLAENGAFRRLSDRTISLPSARPETRYSFAAYDEYLNRTMVELLLINPREKLSRSVQLGFFIAGFFASR